MNVGDLILIGGTGGSAQANEVISGETFTNDAGQGTGTMPNRGAVIYTPSTVDQNVVVGYHNGLGKVLGDADLIAANIKNGVVISGVTGTYDNSPVLTAGSQILLSSDGVRYTNGVTLQIVKAFSLVYGGSYNVYFDLRSYGTTPAYGRIYKNGVAFGTLRTKYDTTYTTYAETLTFAAGDLIQLYTGGNDTGFIQNFRICIAGAIFGTLTVDKSQ